MDRELAAGLGIVGAIIGAGIARAWYQRDRRAFDGREARRARGESVPIIGAQWKAPIRVGWGLSLPRWAWWGLAGLAGSVAYVLLWQVGR